LEGPTGIGVQQRGEISKLLKAMVGEITMSDEEVAELRSVNLLSLEGLLDQR
jgi:hypothetical protein